MKKLAIIITHPIQYYAPWFKMLSQKGNILVKVFYTWSQSQNEILDSGFGKKIDWDIPLLEGYPYKFVENTAKQPSVLSFFGIKTPTLTSEIELFGADAILVFGWNYYSHLRAILYFNNKIPVYFRGDSNLLDENKGFKTLLRRNWLKFVYRNITKAFYVGTNNKNYYLKHGLRENQLVFAPHAIDNNRFSALAEEKNKKAITWRKEIGIPETHLVILFIGKFENKKNPEILLTIADKLKGKNISFLFVGNGELESKLKKQAQNLTNVYFLEFQNQSQMPIVYRLGDVFVLPSKGPFETWGLAVNEAMACSKAIIASSKVGCSIDLISNNGFIFNSENELELMENILFFDKNRKTINEFGNNSYKNIQAWNFDKIVSAIEKELLY